MYANGPSHSIPPPDCRREATEIHSVRSDANGRGDVIHSITASEPMPLSVPSGKVDEKHCFTSTHLMPGVNI